MTTIGRRNACDKFTLHDYGPVYERYLGHLRDEPIKILEIGIGGLEAALGGQSLAVWEEYFPKAEIYGVDIYDKSILDRVRVKTILADQSDSAAMHEVGQKHGPFDVVIDDGSHIAHHVVTSFFALFKHIKLGGYYIIEDLQTSYWPNYCGTSIAGSLLDTPIRWLKIMVDVINSGEILEPRHIAFSLDTVVDEMHVHHNIAALRRGPDRPKSRILTVESRAALLAQDIQQLGRYADLERSLEMDLEARRRFLDTVLATSGRT